MKYDMSLEDRLYKSQSLKHKIAPVVIAITIIYVVIKLVL